MSLISDERMAGWVSGMNNLPIVTCPFEVGGKSWEDWHKGWLEAIQAFDSIVDEDGYAWEM